MARLLALCMLGFVFVGPLSSQPSDSFEPSIDAAGAGAGIELAQQGGTYGGAAVAVHTNLLKADVSVPFGAANYPHSETPPEHAWVHIGLGESYAVANQEFLYDMELRAGARLRIVEVLDDDNVRVEDADDRTYLAPSAVRSYAESNRWRTLNGAATEAMTVRLYLPNGTRLTIPRHALQDGDVIRITEIIEPLRARFLGGGFHADEVGRRVYGAEASQANAPRAVRTWPQRRTMPIDAFFVEGVGWSFVDLWVDESGASSAQSHDVRGRFSYELAERGGVRRWTVARATAGGARRSESAP